MGENLGGKKKRTRLMNAVKHYVSIRQMGTPPGNLDDFRGHKRLEIVATNTLLSIKKNNQWPISETITCNTRDVLWRTD